MSDEDKKTTKKKEKEIDSSKYINLDPSIDNVDFSDEDPEDEIAEALTPAQRRQRGRTMRRHRAKIAMGRRRAKMRTASTDKLKQRARRKARNLIRQRLSQGRSYKKMSPAEKTALDKRLDKISDTRIDQIATRELPKVRQAERQRRANMSKNKKEDINELFESRMEQFDAKQREDNPSKKRFHLMYNKEGAVKLDKRFKLFRKKSDDVVEAVEELMKVVEYSMTPDIRQAAIEKEYGRKVKMALDMIRKEVRAQGSRQSIEGYAHDVLMAIPLKMTPKELASVYRKMYESADPMDREQGTNKLTNTYKKDTPGQEDSANTDTKCGDRVLVTSENDNNAAKDREGMVVEITEAGCLVRDGEGRLFSVPFSNLEIIETLDERFNKLFEGPRDA
jgi:hypothetical protein